MPGFLAIPGAAQPGAIEPGRAGTISPGPGPGGAVSLPPLYPRPANRSVIVAFAAGRSGAAHS
jgi:hypothetical protein